VNELQYNKHVGSRIKEMRKSRKMTLKELGEHIGLSESNTKRYEDGQIKTVGIDIIKKIALALDVPASYLTGWEEIPQYQKLSNYVPIAKKKIPLFGEIAAGQPIYADEHIEEFLPVDDEVKADFALKIKGDSMINAQINDGDIVFIRQQSDVDNGQIAAVLIDDSATLKRVYHMDGVIQLQAENPQYPPMIYSKNNCDECRILGLAVAVLGKVK
jgi:repressor lexA